MNNALRAVWRFRGFVLTSVKREFQSKYRNSLLGAAWMVIHPLSMILVYTVIFSHMMKSKLPGVEGGFALQRSPADITLLDVIEAVEGHTALQRCVGDMEKCTRDCGGMCSINAAFTGIQNDLSSRLKSINFADLAKQESVLHDTLE